MEEMTEMVRQANKIKKGKVVSDVGDAH